MEIVLALAVLVSALAFLVGLILAIIRKPRGRGFKVAGIAMLVFVAATVPFVWIGERNATNEGFLSVADRNKARDAGYTSAGQWSEVRDAYFAVDVAQTAPPIVANQPESVIEPVQQSLGDFPDQQTQLVANEAGIQRYAAYRLIEDRDAITTYCAFNEQSYELAADKDLQVDATTDEALVRQLEVAHEEAQQILLRETNQTLGLEEYEIHTLAIAGHWLAYCRAQEEGWAVLTANMARSASRGDARAAEDAISAYYMYRLYNRPSNFFNRERFGSVSCARQTYEDLRIVGCRMQSLAEVTAYDLFVIGRDEEARLLVSPLTGPSQTNLASEDSVIRAAGQDTIHLSKFAHDPINAREIREGF